MPCDRWILFDLPMIVRTTPALIQSRVRPARPASPPECPARGSWSHAVVATPDWMGVAMRGKRGHRVDRALVESFWRVRATGLPVMRAAAHAGLARGIARSV